MVDLYQSQRSARQMRKVVLQKGVIAILDVGSNKIACLILQLDGTDWEGASDGGKLLTGHSGFQTLGFAITQSRGVRLGKINSTRETERAIRTVLQSAQKMANTAVSHVIVSMAGGKPQAYGLVGSSDIDGGQVSEDDVARAISSRATPNFGKTREVLHAQPINFTLDNRSGLSNPLGMAGDKLFVDVNTITMDAEDVQKIMCCVNHCGVELVGIVSSAYVSGLSSLFKDERERGAACVDVGGDTTSLSIFLKSKMINIGTVIKGGNQITDSISSALKIPSTRAERIKTFYGGVYATGTDNHEHIEIGSRTGENDHNSRSVSRTELIGIIKPRIEEILEDVRTKLDNEAFYHLPNQQIVLTGGGSQIPGLDTLASHILGKQVRFGRPLREHGFPHVATGPAFSAAVGLCVLAANPQVEFLYPNLITPE